MTLTPIRFKERADICIGEQGRHSGRRHAVDVPRVRPSGATGSLTRSQALGVERGQRVAWLGYNSHELLEAYYGVVQMGAVLLPLNIRLTPQEIAFILNDSETVTLFYNRDFMPLVDAIRSQAPTVKHCIPLEKDASVGDDEDYETLIAAAGADFTPPPDIKDDELAELFYTSGTTANPKGVMMTHRNLYLHAMQVDGRIGRQGP